MFILNLALLTEAEGKLFWMDVIKEKRDVKIINNYLSLTLWACIHYIKTIASFQIKLN